MSARMIEGAGFQATCVSGAWTAATRGFPDVGLITLTEMAEQAKYIAQAVSVPVMADVDTGFGGLLNVERCVNEFERAGVASVQIEDQGYPKRCGLMTDKILVPPDEMVDKIRVAVNARSDQDFVIIARTDALASEGVHAAIDRGRHYLDAGADMLFVEAITDPADACLIGESFPDHHLVFNQTPTSFSPSIKLKALADWGYSIVYFSTQVLLAGLYVQQQLLAELKREGRCDAFEEHMLSIDEFFAVLPEVAV